VFESRGISPRLANQLQIHQLSPARYIQQVLWENEREDFPKNFSWYSAYGRQPTAVQPKLLFKPLGAGTGTQLRDLGGEVVNLALG
jgi:hypothetical protein